VSVPQAIQERHRHALEGRLLDGVQLDAERAIQIAKALNAKPLVRSNWLCPRENL
jgi:hypothetical protein